MVWTRRVAITLLALTVVMSQAITAAAAPGKGADQAQGKGGAKVEAKVETAKEATEGEEAELPECEPAETDETLSAEGDESTTPAEGEEPAPVEGEEPAPAEGEEPAPVEGEEPAPVEGEEPAPCKEPASGKNMTGRGKSAQHNPNVNADGILVPGTAATMTQEQKEAKIAEVKAESRSMAKADRAKGEQGQYLVYVNGERLNLTPVAKNGRTLVPFRKLAEFLGATVDWEPNTRTVIMVKGETKVEIAIGAETALINGEEVPVQVAAELIGSSTFVPLRFIAEALGADVDYDAETGAITVITVGEGTEPAPTEPGATEPAPTEPAPTEPAPTEPAPTEPAPTEPAPTEPAPTEPAPTEPAPTEPAPTEPAPTEPAPTEPAPGN